ncbi:hypothetical protein [Streptomyces hygroscopicus]|uniref:hypothetical protein n=1 Tax=Streptomyces hygroscopicus TaxID=1912 RepID=UPI000830E221|nr:hypothetical protein [Streptomyces hygroscopicus]GLV77532.1 hypothetical protein Shyhy02_55320 [Streptomyces hygroscopicus subsp. hygroscopicus]
MTGGPDAHDSWFAEYVTSEEYATDGLPPEARAEVDTIVRGLLDLAELRLEAGNDYDEQNPRKLRSISTDKLILWYQKFEYRKRIYIVRINWFG